jgi:hypothetical protein
MNLSNILLWIAGVGLSLLLAWLPWRGQLTSGLARLAMGSRVLAILAILLLVFDPGIRARIVGVERLILLDNSVSMHAAGGHADSARVIAEAMGEVRAFGELTSDEPGGRSLLEPELSSAVAVGRPITVVTDGEVRDANTIPADIMAQATVLTIARQHSPDVAITDVRMPDRIAAGDSLKVEVDLSASGGWSDSVTVEILDGDRTVFSGEVGFAGPDRRARLVLNGTLPADLTGERWLNIQVADVDDAEPDDHQRLRRVLVTPSPGIVVVVEHPDWDARFLYTVLGSVTVSPVRGFIQITPGLWRRMDDLTPVALNDVVAAARDADLLAVRGDTTAWARLGRARLLWPAGGTVGDWYLSPGGVSPVASAFTGLDTDSLPPALAILPQPPRDWTAVTAQLARRGEEIPVMTGSSVAGRTVVLGVQGLYRWGLGGGTAEQVWRTMMAQATSWLLDAPSQEGAPARPMKSVTQRGRPVRFLSAAVGVRELPITTTTASVTTIDTLRFDPNGVAELALSPGRYSYRFADGTGGNLAVEQFADELVPAAVTMTSRDAAVVPSPPKRSLRELLPLFALAIAGLGLEWILRRQLGLR